MPTIHHGRPGGTLEATGEKYGHAGAVGARFERQVAEALEQWLSHRPESVHVFHDLSGLHTRHPTKARELNLGTTNIDHVVLTGTGWIMLDAKGSAPGQLRVERHRGVLVTSEGTRRPQPWLDDGRAYSRAGSLFDLTGKTGVMAWVVPDHVDYTHPSLRRARCFRENSLLLTLSELACGDLEQAIPDLLPVPYAPATDSDVARLRQHTAS